MTASSTRLRGAWRWATTLRCPDPAGAFVAEGDSLALYRAAPALAGYWEAHWADDERAERLIAAGRAGDLGELGPVFDRYLAHPQRVLEAGAGLGWVAFALAERGHTVIGVEYDARAVDAGRVAFPGLDLRLGDVEHLDLPDASIDAYVSLGVLEHIESGADRALAEAHRVVAPGGLLLMSVPVVNAGRARLLRSDDLPTDPGDRSFYQRYYRPDDLVRAVERPGFRVEATVPLYAEHALVRENPVVRRVWFSRLGRPGALRVASRALAGAPTPLRRRWAHMAMVVARRR